MEGMYKINREIGRSLIISDRCFEAPFTLDNRSLVRWVALCYHVHSTQLKKKGKKKRKKNKQIGSSIPFVVSSTLTLFDN